MSVGGAVVKSRLGFLDGARAVAAVAVVLVHVRATVPAMTLPGPVDRLFNTGHYAVTVFIVISGFSLGLGWAKRSGTQGWIREFVFRRFWRIVPTYWASIALAVALILTLIGNPTGTHWDVVLPLEWKGVWVHGLLLQDVIPSKPPNHVFWSIAIEWHIYFLFPLILLLVLRRRGVSWCALIAAFVYGLWLTGETQLAGMTIQYVACFALGVLAAVRSSPGASAQVLVRLTLLGTLTAAATSVMLFLGPVPLPAMNALVDLPLAVAAAGAFALMRVGRLRPAAAILGWRPLAGLGVFAYSIYLVHAPLLQVIWQYLIRPSGARGLAEFALLLGPGAALAVIGSYGFFLVAERPFLGRPHLTVRLPRQSAAENPDREPARR